MNYRKALFSAKLEKAMLEIADEISERYEIDFERIGCDADYIHILCSFNTPWLATGYLLREP